MTAIGHDDAEHTCQLRCLFPVSDKRTGLAVDEIDCFPTLPIHSGQQDDWSDGTCPPWNAELLLSSWAILLNSYTGNEHVFFSVIRPTPVFSNGNGIDQLGTCNGIEQRVPNGVSTLDETIVGYDSSKDGALTEVCQASKAAWKRGGSDMLVNTAVCFTDPNLISTYRRRDEEQVPKRFKGDLSESHKSQRFDIWVDIADNSSRIDLRYKKSRVSKAYAQSIKHYFVSIMDSRRMSPNVATRNLNTLGKPQELQIQGWNVPNPLSVEESSCMHDLVSAKCNDLPLSTEAICSWDGSLTYKELDDLSNKAANRFRFAGVTHGSCVPFAFEKSMWTIVATLGILKAGAAFMPLNPQDPKTRLQQLLNAVDAKVMAVSQEHERMFADLVDMPVVISSATLKEPRAHSNAHDTTETPTKSTADDPIFVLFTSGSTGTAKGMIHTHRSITTHALVHGHSMGYHSARVLQFAAHTFDVAFMDIFTTLLFGGCVCIPSEESRRGSGIVDAIARMHVDYAILTPSFAGVLDPADVPTLRTLAVGGEPLPQERIERWAGKVRLIQIYGPAEVGICLSMDMTVGVQPKTVGRPLENSSCWLVNPDCVDELVPIGAVGEMVVAGPSLARGYLNHSKRTAEAFIGPPEWARRLGLPFERFYLTGDLLRYNVDRFDGSFDFVGRKDAQIKLRGQRIEPGEVEYHIGRMRNVAVCMVARPVEGCFQGDLVAILQMRASSTAAAPSDGGDGDLQLVMEQADQRADVRRYLRDLLPRYMIPNVVLTMRAMPFVPSMKVDRKRVERWLTSMSTKPSAISAWSTLAALNGNDSTAIALSLKISELLSSKDENRALALQERDFVIQEAGINSIHLTSLSIFIAKTFAKRIPMETLLSSNVTIRQLADIIDATPSRTTNGYHPPLQTPKPHTLPISVRKEATTLRATLTQTLLSLPPPPRTAGPITNILLTGATGYLGPTLLTHLLTSSPKTQIYVLIRSPNPSDAPTRLHAALTAQNIRLTPQALARIHTWPGDLARPNLGLADSQLQKLLGLDTDDANAIHAIVHSGATVHYGHDYERLKACNVGGTYEALRLAAQARFVRVFVFVSGGMLPSFEVGMAGEGAEERVWEAGGYAISKVVAEGLVRGFMGGSANGEEEEENKEELEEEEVVKSDCGLASRAAQRRRLRAYMPARMRVVKPGYIIGNARHGIANRGDFLWRLVAGCVEIGAFADEAAEQEGAKARWLYVADGDEVAEAVVGGDLLLGPSGRSGVVTMATEEACADDDKGAVRVLSGILLDELWSLLREHFGYRLVALPRAEWVANMVRRVEDVGETHALFPLLHHVLRRGGGDVGEVMREGSDMRDSGRVKEAVLKNVEYLIRVGLMPTPPGGGVDEV